MCMFSRPVRHVAGTRIFARHFDDGEQALVYSMNVGLDEPTAMILPLPIPPGCGEDALRFVDLSDYSAFFEHLGRAFPAPAARGRGAMLQSIEPESQTLRVHEVGDFVASFVPSRTDFARLDERFRLSDDVWSKLPYDDWGFAVFQLAKKVGLLQRIAGVVKKQTIHPMAFVFPRRDPKTLFFPTLHVHDGAVHATAEFDHQLYCQPDAVTAMSFGWRKSHGPIGSYLDASRAKSLVDPDQPAYAETIVGRNPNRDVLLTTPDVELDVLRPAHANFALELNAAAAYWDATESNATRRRVALHHMKSISGKLVKRLESLTESKRDAWQLDTYDESAIDYMMSSTLNKGVREVKLTAPGQPLPWGPGWKPPTGRGRARWGLQDDRIGSVGVRLTFVELPTSDTYLEIQNELDALLAAVSSELDLA